MQTIAEALQPLIDAHARTIRRMMGWPLHRADTRVRRRPNMRRPAHRAAR